MFLRISKGSSLGFLCCSDRNQTADTGLAIGKEFFTERNNHFVIAIKQYMAWFVLHKKLVIEGQCLSNVLAVSATSGISFLFSGYIGFKEKDLILLAALTLIAISFNIVSVLIAARSKIHNPYHPEKY